MKLTLPIVLMMLALFFPAAAAAPPALVPTNWSANFDNGTISGWESYPAFEDTAYDFTILPGSFRPRYHVQGFVASGEYFYPVDLAPPGEDPANTHYLLRSLRPNSTSPQRIGAIYKIPNLYAAEQSSLSFDYWLQVPPGPVRLRMDLAGADGRRYQALISQPARHEWTRVQIPLADFTAADGTRLSSGLRLAALAVQALIDRGDPGSYVYVALDNFSIDGKRQAGFSFTTPTSNAYEHWAIRFAQRHYRPGETLDLSVASDGGPLREAWARLEDFDGRPLAERMELTGGPERFEAPAAYRFGENDPHGPLTLTVEGLRDDGSIARSQTRLWLLAPVPDSHPRVLVGAGDRKRLSELVKEDRWSGMWQTMQRAAKANNQRQVPTNFQLNDYPHDFLLQAGSWSPILRGNSTAALQNAWVWFLGGDEEAGNWAKETMLTMAGWDYWVHPWFRGQGRATYYPVGQVTEQLGLAYDLIRPLFTPEEAAAFRAGLMRNGIIPSFEEYFLNNRIPSNTSNWISHSTASVGIALLAVMGEGNEGGMNEFGEPYFSAMAEKFIMLSKMAMRSDGGYGEDYSYGAYTNYTAQPFLFMLDRLGADRLSEQLHYTRGHLYPTYVTTTVNGDKPGMLVMGDAYSGPGGGDRFTYFASLAKDPTAAWFALRSGEPSLTRLIMSDDDLEQRAQSPAEAGLPPARIFPEMGKAVFRAGWDDKDAVFVMRAGPNYNHTHFDMGHFRLAALGQDLASEGGIAHYYTDPYYWSWFIQAAAHNVVLVDDNPESQFAGDFLDEIPAFDDYARVGDWVLGDGIQFARADLAMIYHADFDTYERRAWFVDPGYAIIHDRLRAADGPHHYHWQLHPPDRDSLSVSETHAAIRAGDVLLQVEIAAPADARLAVKPAPIPIREYEAYPEKPLRPRAVLQVINESPRADADFLVALLPRRNEDSAWITETVGGEGYEGIEVRRGDRRDLFCFASGGSINGEIRTDGESAFLRREGDLITAAGCEQATQLAAADLTLLRASGPVTASGRRTSEGTRWSFQAPAALDVEVIDGDGQMHRLRLEPGESVHLLPKQ